MPLENEPSAALALTFTGLPVTEIEFFGFLGRLSGVLKERPPLVSTTPYRPGLIPVVFVHGTASSVVRWAEVFNRLEADPDLRSHYQFWFFQYDSGNPIAASALLLRDSLNAAVAKLDPQGKDPALRRMVLIGHSQGGLLVKMQAISSGDQLWNAASKVPLDDLKLSPATYDLVKRGLFLEPVPGVARVVFLCTPHRGSYVAGRNFIANTVRKLVTLPFALAGAASELATNQTSRQGRNESRGALGGRQHVAAPPLHQGPAEDSRRAEHHGQLDHRGRGRRPGRGGQTTGWSNTRVRTSSPWSPSWS